MVGVVGSNPIAPTRISILVIRGHGLCGPSVWRLPRLGADAVSALRAARPDMRSSGSAAHRPSPFRPPVPRARRGDLVVRCARVASSAARRRAARLTRRDDVAPCTQSTHDGNSRLESVCDLRAAALRYHGPRGAGRPVSRAPGCVSVLAQPLLSDRSPSDLLACFFDSSPGRPCHGERPTLRIQS